MALKASWFFTMGSSGWTESLINSSDDYGVVMARAQTLASDRRAFMPTSCSLTYIRVSDPTNPRHVFPQAGPGAGTGSAANYGGAWSFEAVLCGLTTSLTGVRGRIFLRPAPAVPSGTWPNPPGIPGYWLVDSAPWRTTVQDGTQGWSVRGITNALPTVRVKGIPTISAGTLTLALTGPPGFVPGARFRLSRTVPVDCHLPLNGVYIAETVNVTDNVITAITSLSNRQAHADIGFVRGQALTNLAILSVDPLRIVSHRTGRPFGLQRGRRSRRVTCRCV